MNFKIEPAATTPEQRKAAIAELRHAILHPIAPVPANSLRLLFEAACHDTGGSQAVRSFLFWLAGEPDATGFQGQGGLELRLLDYSLRQAAVEVFTWWTGPTKSDTPLYDLLGKLEVQFAPLPPTPNVDP